MLNEEFVEFSIDPYSKNDLAAAPETDLKEGDLALRDRGYLTNDEFQRHLDSSADCIYRYKFGTVVLDEKTGAVIDLLEKLEKQGAADMTVRLNNKRQTAVRLIAERVSDEIAGERRRKAKLENKSKPTEKYLKMLSWSIYITTLSEEEYGYREILGLYSLRWRIEIIFKSWKSSMAFDKIHNVSKTQLHIILAARFIMALIITQHLYSPCRSVIRQGLNRHLSLIKTVRYLSKYPCRIAKLINELHQIEKGNLKEIRRLAKYCCYEKRKDRLNFEEMIELHMS